MIELYYIAVVLLGLGAYLWGYADGLRKAKKDLEELHK